jgi:hypothetical protein
MYGITSFQRLYHDLDIAGYFPSHFPANFSRAVWAEFSDGAKMVGESRGSYISFADSSRANNFYKVELGVSIETKENPSEYLRLFGNRTRFTRHEYSSRKGTETITYSKLKGSFQFSGYDKTTEAIQKHKQIPTMFEGLNILRLEYKIVRRRGIKAKFHRGLTDYDLFNPAVYEKFKTLFLEAYQTIPKFGRQFYVDSFVNITPKKWDEILAEQYRHSFPNEYRDLIQSLRESGAISDKSFEWIRATERRREREYNMVDKSPLVVELDEKVRSVVQC